MFLLFFPLRPFDLLTFRHFFIVRFGFHLSIAGGFSKVVPRALKLGCETIQFFSRSPRSWKECLIRDEEVTAFRGALKGSGIEPLFLHAPYLLNLATGDRQLYKRSIEYLRDEMVQAERLGAHYVVVHAGNRMSTREETACRRVSQGITTVLGGVENSVIILIENTAGQGTEIGYSFSQLNSIVEGVRQQERVGICLDTAHAFAAGYDISKKKGVNDMVTEVDAVMGLDRLKVLHLNDTRSSCGSRADRHWHIGKGSIGLAGFKHIVNHKLLGHLPGIMETPKKSPVDDVRNMKVLKKLRIP